MEPHPLHLDFHNSLAHPIRSSIYSQANRHGANAKGIAVKHIQKSRRCQLKIKNNSCRHKAHDHLLGFFCCQSGFDFFFHINLISQHTGYLLNDISKITAASFGCVQNRSKILNVLYPASFSKVQEQVFHRNAYLLLIFYVSEFARNVRIFLI